MCRTTFQPLPRHALRCREHLSANACLLLHKLCSSSLRLVGTAVSRPPKSACASRRRAQLPAASAGVSCSVGAAESPAKQRRPASEGQSTCRATWQLSCYAQELAALSGALVLLAVFCNVVAMLQIEMMAHLRGKDVKPAALPYLQHCQSLRCSNTLT